MTTLPADEDYAKSLLSIFGDKGIRPGQSLKATQVNLEFLAKSMGKAADYQSALTYSADRGWLKLELGLIRLTKTGFAEM